MTRLELQAFVESNVGRTDKTTEIVRGINLGLKELCRYHSFRDLYSESDLTLADSSNELTLPSDMMHLHEIRVIDGTMSFPVAIKDKKWVVDRWPNITALSESSPTLGYEEGGIFYTYPVANEEYTMRVTYIKEPADFASDSTENPIGVLDYSLGCWATGFTLDTISQFEKANVWYARAAASVPAAIRQDKRTRVERIATPFGRDTYVSAEPWNDPFVRSTP